MKKTLVLITLLSTLICALSQYHIDVPATGASSVSEIECNGDNPVWRVYVLLLTHADTNLTNGAHINSIRKIGTNMSLTMNLSSNKTYQLQCAPFYPVTWFALTNFPVSATNKLVTYVDPMQAQYNKLFYRLMSN